MTVFRNQSLETNLHQPPANVSLSIQLSLNESLKLVNVMIFKFFWHQRTSCYLTNYILSTSKEKVYILPAVKVFKDKLCEKTSGFPLYFIIHKTKSESWQVKQLILLTKWTVLSQKKDAHSMT